MYVSEVNKRDDQVPANDNYRYIIDVYSQFYTCSIKTRDCYLEENIDLKAWGCLGVKKNVRNLAARFIVETTEMRKPRNNNLWPKFNLPR